MAKNWWCEGCRADIDTKVDGCAKQDHKGPCALWWQPATWFGQLMCNVGRCICPVGPGYCINCRDK